MPDRGAELGRPGGGGVADGTRGVIRRRPLPGGPSASPWGWEPSERVVGGGGSGTGEGSVAGPEGLPPPAPHDGGGGVEQREAVVGVRERLLDVTSRTALRVGCRGDPSAPSVRISGGDCSWEVWTTGPRLRMGEREAMAVSGMLL